MTLWTVGFFLRVSRKMRVQKLNRILTKFSKAYVGLWRLRRRIRYKKSIALFVKKNEEIPLLLLFNMNVVYKIRLIQKWFRRYLVKRTVLLALLNCEWSSIEYAILRVTSVEEGNESPRFRRTVDKCVAEGKHSDIVPIEIRLFYIKNHLEVILVDKVFLGNKQKIWRKFERIFK